MKNHEPQKEKAKIEDIDSFAQSMAEMMVSEQHDMGHFGKSKTQLKQQAFLKVKDSVKEAQDLLKQGLDICQSQLPEYEYQRIFVDILSDFSAEKSPKIDEPESALIGEADYELILALTDELEEKNLFKESLSLYMVLMTFAPHDYRSYLNYGLVLQKTHDKFTSAQYFEAITEMMCNPFIDYHGAKCLLDTGNQLKASTLIERAIGTLTQSEDFSDEVEQIKSGLVEFKTTHQL